MKDINQIAHKITQEATKEKNPAAVALGRLGGLKGGHARAKKLTPEQRKEIARKAVKARWSKGKDHLTSRNGIAIDEVVSKMTKLSKAYPNKKVTYSIKEKVISVQ